MTNWTNSLGQLSKPLPTGRLKRKAEQQATLSADIQAFLDAGNEIEQVACPTPEDVKSRRVGMPRGDYF